MKKAKKKKQQKRSHSNTHTKYEEHIARETAEFYFFLLNFCIVIVITR